MINLNLKYYFNPNRLLYIVYLTLLLPGIMLNSCAKGKSSLNYYFDPVSGNDSINTGLAPESSFKSLSMIRKINLKPGDSILLKSGAVFSEQLYISCKGDSGRPIVVGKFGGEAKPFIRANGRYNDGIHVFNSEYLVIRDLEISNKGETPIDGMNGVLVELKDYGTAKDITIDNLFIHDVYGILVREHLGGGNAILMRNFENSDTLSQSSRFDGLVVQNCYIKDCQRNGIMMWGNWIRSKWNPSVNVVFRHNVLDGVPGDGIVPVACEKPLVEYNVMKNCPPTLPATEPCDGIWPWSCDNAVVQFNVVSDHKSKVDGFAYDSDWNSNNSLFQFNLSYNNDGGFLLICNSGGWPLDWSIGNRGTRIRYNISINDGLRNYIGAAYGEYFSPVISIGGPTLNTIIEKNLFCILKKEKPEIDRTIVNLSNWSGYPDSTAFRNNYIFAEEETRAVKTSSSTRNFYNGNYYVGELKHPEGFINHDGAFDKNLWYEPSDPNWNSLIEFVKEKTIPLKGREIKVLYIIGY